MDKQINWRLEDGGFLALVLLVTLAFGWLLTPYFGAILWGVVAAILFFPLNRRVVRRLNGHANTASLLTLSLIVLLVIVPAIFIAFSLVQEATLIYGQLQSGEIDLDAMFRQMLNGLPTWAADMLRNWGLANFDAARDTIASSMAAGLDNIASQALTVGQGALRFLAALGIMLYLTYFLLRDGAQISERIKDAVPLHPDLRDELGRHFVVVVRATMRGSVVVAIMQGLVGGIIFGLLGIEGALIWGLIMGFFSLIPAVGTGIVWVPVAIYLLATGSTWQGMVLIATGVFVIGLIDNLLRPILVGHDTRLPDFVVLIATLAGLELFGLNGIIIGPMIAALFIAVWQTVARRRLAASTPAADSPGPVTASLAPDTTPPST